MQQGRLPVTRIHASCQREESPKIYRDFSTLAAAYAAVAADRTYVALTSRSSNVADALVEAAAARLTSVAATFRLVIASLLSSSWACAFPT